MATVVLLFLSAVATSQILWHPAFTLLLHCLRVVLTQCYRALRLLLAFGWFLLHRSRSTVVGAGRALRIVGHKLLKRMRRCCKSGGKGGGDSWHSKGKGRSERRRHYHGCRCDENELGAASAGQRARGDDADEADGAGGASFAWCG